MKGIKDTRHKWGEVVSSIHQQILTDITYYILIITKPRALENIGNYGSTEERV